LTKLLIFNKHRNGINQTEFLVKLCEGNTMKRQWTNWGYIDWLDEDMNKHTSALNVGVVSINPLAHMNPHIHFTEQVLYTLQGKGYSLINGKRIDMSQSNKILHWKASVIHEMYNEGDIPFKHLMISCPDIIGSNTDLSSNTVNWSMSADNAEEYLQATIKGTCEQFLDTLHYSYVIFDAKGIPVKKAHIFPQYCTYHCQGKIVMENAFCMQNYIDCPFKEEQSFECPHGLTVFCVPIVFQGVFLGYVQGGYVHMHSVSEDCVYVTPQSSIEGAQVLLRRIVKSMVNYCEFYQLKNQLMKQDLILEDTRQYQNTLELDLKNAKSAMTDLKINNHFLFNTLNQMASMALSGGMESLYQSILDLSQLFSYTVHNNSNTVLLSKEFEYLNSYLKLQKLRYGKKLHLDYTINLNMAYYKVPFNFLMPIAENAFTHGFSQEEEKFFYLGIKEKSNSLIFTIENSGTLPKEASRYKIMSEIKNGTTHGLSMVYQKLQSVYFENFSIEIQKGQHGGFEVKLTLPSIKIR